MKSWKFHVSRRCSLFCGEPFFSHDSLGGLTEYSPSSISGVAVGAALAACDDAVSVGDITAACDVDAISGLNEPPETADSVSSFSSLREEYVNEINEVRPSQCFVQ